ncbi:hypothetical protein NQ314_020095 [Rhamnusium bicolor]|uniref:Uncharacterized protein n=1 Tax=Rhamnusium bicolor TaxID=1586634 RepID=A0AAV8WMK7_9CUCU|nr:hypothetical protein NQ314_020095 [Rhamnusium bicolor]
MGTSIISDRWCLSSIQIQWNLENFGGFQELIKWEDIKYDDDSMINFVDELKLSSYDLNAIKSSCISFCIRKYLNTIQNGTSHKIVIESVDYLTL